MGAEEDVRRRCLVVAGAALLALLMTGLAFSKVGRSGTERDSPGTGDVAQRSDPIAVVPTSEVAGMASGFADSDAGAVQAGVAYATASQRWLYFSDDEIAAAVDQIATARSSDRIEDEVLADVRDAREGLGGSSGRVWWLVRPLAWTLEEQADGGARVSVWVVTILSAAEVAAPQTEWMTVDVDLRWEKNDWRVDDSRSTPGPTPMVGPGDRPWDAVPFDEGLDGFIRMDGEPVR